MFCPNCGKSFDYVTVDEQSILHCTNCGSSFFEENVINRLTVDGAKKLAGDKTTDEVSGNPKKCPKDHAVMTPVEGSEAVPANVTLLKCPLCHGIFSYPDDLVLFKKAQNVKIEYHKLWNLPFPSLRAVMVLSVLLLLGVSMFSVYNTFLRGTSRSTQATDLIKKVTISKFGHYILVYFKTTSPFSSKINFFDKTQNMTFVKPVTSTPQTTHQLTTTDIDSTHDITYQIILTDTTGQEYRTELKKLETQ